MRPAIPFGSCVANILDILNDTVPAGGTPTATAFDQAYDYFTQGKGKELTGTKWILLATDGGPNCNFSLSCDVSRCTQNIDCKCAGGCDAGLNCCQGDYGYVCLDDTATTVAIAKLAAAGINTFVVGIPGSEAYAASLNSFANAGKMPNLHGTSGKSHYAVSSTASLDDLKQAFGEITQQLTATCDIPLSHTPSVADKINVAIGCSLQPQVPVGTATDAGVNGYYIDYNQSPAHLVLVGAACDDVMTNGARQVDIIAGCESIH